MEHTQLEIELVDPMRTEISDDEIDHLVGLFVSRGKNAGSKFGTSKMPH